ncbi:MAG: hypothetical protein HON47_02960 [Candidatus Diapherotrites archaeon]|uniref:Glycosyl transferase family 1 domain-containing protein n=1 Tax=Candidatus Iainarchaeum sp. TaxID=3101447 RepID=A0A8T5GFK6_9ARCH|nr:hypothetical protein [Candidatus Diapherotrites archaeon]
MDSKPLLDQTNFKRYTKRSLKKLNYAMIHSRFGMPDGVSIVMKQIEQVMVKELEIPKDNIYYLVGKSGKKDKNIVEKKALFDATRLNTSLKKNYKIGFGGNISEKLEKAIQDAQKEIQNFIEKKKIDILIAHNTCHPVNFVLSVALSRYYRDCINQKKKTPKYLLWWHDSHLERDHFLYPAKDVERYLLQGIPGPYPEYIFFINSTQYKEADKYFDKLELVRPGFHESISRNNDVIYNTTETFIESFKDLDSDKLSDRVDKFIEDFDLKNYLKQRRTNLKDTIFCLQHTSIVKRKRIDFALEYCFELIAEINKNRKHKKSLYFLISGNDDKDGSKRKILAKYNQLCKKHKTKHVFLAFAEQYYKKTDIMFEEYPRIFAKLGGFSTYFSEIEGFGNNLLEVLASGLIPVLYTYPVFVSDIQKYGFKTVALDKFEVDNESIKEMIEVLDNNRKRKIWVNMNLELLRTHFAHEIIALKLGRGIMRRRTHQ